MSKESSKDTATELGELLDQAGLKLTFDRFRDSTKGCGPHCLAWERHNPDATWCPNHKAAMERGEYKPNPGSERTQTDTYLSEVRARYEQNAKGYHQGWSEAEGRFGLLGDRCSGGLVEVSKYDQIIGALLCCTADIPKLLERVTQAETALADKKDIIQAFKKQNRELLALQAPLATPDAWDQARAYVEAQDYVNDENRNAAGNGYVAGWRDRGEVAPAGGNKDG